MMNILHVVGARPNFMKAAPVIDALDQHGVAQTLVHTGQHYDTAMSEIFFEELGLPQPDVNLGVGSGSHTIQTAQVMIRFEETVLQHQPELVLVYGDVNSTVAATLVCSKLGIRVGHVEAGLRSFDRTMPEEINRLLTDQIADLLFTPSDDGDQNLLREGVAAGKIHLVGNVMIDTLVRLLPHAETRWPGLQDRLHVCDGHYGLVTLHRPSNVDAPEMLARIMKTLGELSGQIEMLFPIHPRTRRRLDDLGLTQYAPGLHITEPLGYLEFLALQRHAAIVITDSGGIQEETTFLKVPCLTVRENTERPITVSLGTNQLVGQDMDLLLRAASAVLAGTHPKGQVPPLWEGQAAERIATILVQQ